jgi:hypothetical protein
MKLNLILTIAILFCTEQAFAALGKRPGFFGYTRACLKAFDDDRSDHDVWLCVWSIGIFSTFDMAISPTQTLGKLLDSLDKDPNNKKESESSSSTSDKKVQQNEVPEEKKPLAKLSLLFQVADDARDYQIMKTTTPLLDAATRYLTDDGNVELASDKIFKIEAAVIEVLNSQGQANE